MKWGAFSLEMYQIPIGCCGATRRCLAYVLCLVTEQLSIRIKGWFMPRPGAGPHPPLLPDGTSIAGTPDSAGPVPEWADRMPHTCCHRITGDGWYRLALIRVSISTTGKREEFFNTHRPSHSSTRGDCLPNGILGNSGWLLPKNTDCAGG
jgi:hypothetical protein